jgi:hypothetical protein
MPLTEYVMRYVDEAAAAQAYADVFGTFFGCTDPTYGDATIGITDRNERTLQRFRGSSVEGASLEAPPDDAERHPEESRACSRFAWWGPASQS